MGAVRLNLSTVTRFLFYFSQLLIKFAGLFARLNRHFPKFKSTVIYLQK